LIRCWSLILKREELGTLLAYTLGFPNAKGLSSTAATGTG
jgi:hypothetical protein